jgi:hypothetical protein
MTWCFSWWIRRLNEAQGQLQVIVTVSTDYDFAEVGTAHIRTFFRKDRGDDILVLRELLKELFPDDVALHSHMQCVDELRRWTESSDDWTTFAGLLRDLEGNCYAEAAQPPGLSVPLRPYQRQSLQFMLDSEQRDGGFLSVNYQPLQTNVGGTSPMYSASLNHLLLREPHEETSGSTARGGFLCEEMGLGKTIEVTLRATSSTGRFMHSFSSQLVIGVHLSLRESVLPSWCSFPRNIELSSRIGDDFQILALILANPCPVDRCAPASSKGTLGKFH